MTSRDSSMKFIMFAKVEGLTLVLHNWNLQSNFSCLHVKAFNLIINTSPLKHVFVPFFLSENLWCHDVLKWSLNSGCQTEINRFYTENVNRLKTTYTCFSAFRIKKKYCFLLSEIKQFSSEKETLTAFSF